MSYIENTNTKEQDSLDLDAFGRKRVSNANNRLDIEFIYDKQPLLVNEITSGGASVTHYSNTRDLGLLINNATNGTSARMESNFSVPYTPGNSQLIELTGVLNYTPIAGGLAQVFLRSTVSGSTTETVVDQTNWNINTVSDVDWSKSQIFAIDFQSLKVGRIRFGLNRSGVAVPVHQIVNDNLRDSGYWQSASHPIYWEIYNDATYTYMDIGYGDSANAIGFRYRVPVNAGAIMRAICGTVKSEDGAMLLDIPGLPFTANNGVTAKTVSTTLIPVLSIRGAATFNSLTNKSIIIPQSFEISTNNAIRYEIILNGTLTGASYVSVGTNSAAEYDVTASAISGGTSVLSGYVSTARNITSSDKNVLSRVIMSAGDILTIAAVRTGTSDASVLSSINHKEIR